MLSKRELTALKKQLPEGGYQKISERLGNVSAESVKKAFNDPKRYKRDIFFVALEIIQEEKEADEALKNKAKEVLA
ncbi:hypothetical protein BDE36_1807 [Arcticibacter tournemirensis]|uniref:Uncharacterized protein n=1 Tax=Arcticibacter tournemirensis TaxID=699437 RepID=A0A5M9HDP2_9SPHI|nr:hypothetical protein [Arcticibacter tournemirensis]KAA8483731.1 hypothetical protein F1649_07530 [Arcticibacter tournemirensis]TQM50072.1 hypothetical protein BDE36_1807 [Arcticibacter tournemirensis]